MRYILPFLTFVALSFGQTHAGQTHIVKDRNGAPAMLVSDVAVSPGLRGVVKNVSGKDLSAVLVDATFPTKSGRTVVLPLDSLPPRFAKDEVRAFSELWPSERPADAGSVGFRLQSALHVTTKEGFHFSGFLAKDEGCLKDYASAKLLMRVVPDEQLSALVERGCGSFLDKPLAVGITDQKGLRIGENEVIEADVVLYDETLNADAMWRILATEYARLHPGASRFNLGWVLMSELVPGPVQTIEQLGLGRMSLVQSLSPLR